MSTKGYDNKTELLTTLIEKLDYIIAELLEELNMDSQAVKLSVESHH